MASAGKFMYDMAVIGAGSGGVRAARIAGGYGAKVALVELSLHHGPPTYTAAGGTCVNVGCVPKKLMVYGAAFHRSFEDSNAYGWNVDAASVGHKWSTLMSKKDKEISRLNGIYTKMLGNAGVDMLIGRGVLKDKHTVSIQMEGGETKEITADKIVVCTGGWPYKPSIPGIEHAITSNEAFYLADRPKRVLVVGGGYIAVEFASLFNGFGSKVTQMYRSDMFLRGFDDDVRTHLAGEMTKEGIDVQFNSDPKSITKLEDGSFEVETTKGDKSTYDVVMYATGRVPLTRNLGLEALGVNMEEDGTIKVDDLSRTNVDNIFAIGDVTNRMQLTPVALHEGHCLADTLFGSGGERKPNHEHIASAVFSHPEIGTVGLTEAQAVEKFKDVLVFKSTFRPLMHVLTQKDTKVLMKILVSKTDDKVVGVHMVGDHAAEVLQGVAIAVKMGATKADFDRTIGIHPSTAEELVTMRSPSYEYKNGAKL